MHPNAAFHWTDRTEMLDFVSVRSFAHIFTASAVALFAVHAPVIVRNGRIWFHVARRNRIANQLDGRRALVSVSGREGYQSANWYASEDQVPTWHYEAVEIEGTVRQLSGEELISLVDQLSDVMEGRHSPDKPWTRAKMAPGKFEAMTKAIVGFELEPVEVRGTRKFNQHKNEEDRAATIAGQRGAGRDDIVAAIEELAPRDK
ncbi:FMN-binding negative transcriptional regulator [Sphingomonas sp.]|uniref:FMN-binding negative transcriptional regulator n=1 Tax=Sphingomonas sp. TaxID=28214 RepID=UPI0038A13ACC